MIPSRRDQLREQYQVQLNSLALVKPVGNYRRHIVIFLTCFATIALALHFLPWQQTALGTGRVIAYSPNDRKQDINSPIDGRIQMWHVTEGSHIKKGDLIVELTDNDPQILQRMQNERSALKNLADASASAVLTASSNMERQRKLFEKGLSSQKNLEQAQLDYNKYLVDEAQAIAELARMDIRIARQMTQSVTAPTDGTVLNIVSGQGAQIVKKGQIIASFIPDSDSRAVEIWIDGNDIPLVNSDRLARLQFEGWPALQFSGWPSVAIGTFGGQVSLIDAADDGMGRFRVVITPGDEPWPEPLYLRQGVRVIAWILLDEINLGYELWRRFNGFPPSSAHPPGVKVYQEKS